MLLLASCGRSDSSASGQGSGPGQGAGGSSARGVADSAVTQAKQVADSAQKVAEQATAQAQSLIQQAQALVGQQKYQDAAAALEKLAGLKLTAEQQKLVTELKSEVQKIADATAKQVAELKSLVDQKKYSEASALLQQVTSLQLTPDQQRLVDGLKAEIQQALAGKAAGGLLPTGK
jgi:hypothetical protein